MQYFVLCYAYIRLQQGIIGPHDVFEPSINQSIKTLSPADPNVQFFFIQTKELISNGLVTLTTYTHTVGFANHRK